MRTICLLILCFTISVSTFICPHDNTETYVTSPATCTKKGVQKVICLDCNSAIEENELLPTGHFFDEYKITVPPTFAENGVESATCLNCGEQNTREFVCQHITQSTQIEKMATCVDAGKKITRCSICSFILKTEEIARLDCNFGEWIETKGATPLESGEAARTCKDCGRSETKSVYMNMPSDNSIYIPGTGICHEIHIGSLTQKTVDTYDLVYDSDYFGVEGPWVLGHNYGTLNMLYKTKVGQNIYIAVDGNIKVYKVKYSEFALQNDSWTDIIGQDSGVSVLSNLDGETLHLYTCYGRTKNHRWIVLAERVY